MAVRIFPTSACAKALSSGSPVTSAPGVLVAAVLTTTASALVSWYRGSASTPGNEIVTLAACPGQPTPIFAPAWPYYSPCGLYVGFVSGTGSAFTFWKP